MNVSGIIDSLSDLWTRYAPVVVTHVVLLFVLQLWVIQANTFERVPALASALPAFEPALEYFGLKDSRRWVIAVLVLIYLTGLQRLASGVASLRPLQIRVVPRLDPRLIEVAGSVAADAA